jgi:hypothetical protein
LSYQGREKRVIIVHRTNLEQSAIAFLRRSRLPPGFGRESKGAKTVPTGSLGEKHLSAQVRKRSASSGFHNKVK